MSLSQARPRSVGLVSTFVVVFIALIFMLPTSSMNVRGISVDLPDDFGIEYDFGFNEPVLIPSDATNIQGWGRTKNVTAANATCFYYITGTYPGWGYADDYTIATFDDNGVNPNHLSLDYDYEVISVVNDFSETWMLNNTPTTAQYINASELDPTVTVSKVYVVMTWDIATWIPEGWFSIQYNPYESIDAFAPYLVDVVRPYTGFGVDIDSGGWYNSSLISYFPFAGNLDLIFSGDDVTYLWNVTDKYSWTVPMLISDDLYVMHTMVQNLTGTYSVFESEILYLGIYWEFNTGPRTLRPDTYPETELGVGVEGNLSSLIWLLVIFLPPIAFVQFLPKLGFIAGMSISLLVFGIAQAGFIPITVIGIIGIAIVAYKDW